MSAKAIFVFCAVALFEQSVFGQCIGRGYSWGAPWGFGGVYSYGDGYGCGWAGRGLDFSPTSSGGLAVSSASAVPPVGLSVVSENIYGGRLAAAGELPFIGTVGVEGVMPTAGAGAINHHCGDGFNAMVSDGIGYGGAFGYAGAYGFGLGGLGYRGGLVGRGCGCVIY